MITGRGAAADAELGYLAGADDYMIKPFRPQQLIDRVHALPARRHS
nr:hypothetical protein [Actinoplanes polyasparticus]